MIEDKIIATVLRCAEYLNSVGVSTNVIKQMMYSQLKDFPFENIKAIAADEDIEILALLQKDEEKEQEKRNTKRVRESKS
jgi:hypothetical protein